MAAPTPRFPRVPQDDAASNIRGGNTPVDTLASLSRGYMSDFLLALVMRFFQTLSRRQREMKIARVATLELATRQVKKSQEKGRQS